MGNHRPFRRVVVLAVALLSVAPWAITPGPAVDGPASDAAQRGGAGSIAPLRGLPLSGPAALRSALEALLPGALQSDGGLGDADRVPPSRIAPSPSVAIIPPGAATSPGARPRPSQALLKRRSAAGEAGLPPPLS